jgi:hypothetical protein
MSKTIPLPKEISTQTITIKDQMYTILRFAEGKGVNFAQTIAIAKARGKDMLTSDDARKIMDDQESKTAFKSALGPGDDCYILHSEKRPFLGAHFGHVTGTDECFDVIDTVIRPDNPAYVVILKEIGSSEAAITKILRLEYKDQTAVVITANCSSYSHIK